MTDSANADTTSVDFDALLRSHHGNDLAKIPEVRELTRAWLRRSPIVYIWAPSSTGKTTLGGSLFRHPDYRPTLLIGVEDGDDTIGEWTTNDAACVRWVFDGEPSQQRAWIYDRLREAADVDCGAILIEGIASWHKLEVGRVLQTSPGAKGRALQQLCIEPSMRTASVLAAIYDLKLTRKARKRTGPIIVTLNTREQGADDKKQIMPGFSPNLCEQAMQNAEAFIELRRTPSGLSMLTQKTSDIPYRKLRHSVAAEAIESQIDLTLPGLFALWATTIHAKADALAQRLTS